MKQLAFSLFILMFVLFSCKNKQEQKAAASPASAATADTTKFFDVKGFIEGEIKDVTTTPYFLYTITTRDDKKRDSAHLTTTEFVRLAQEFLAQDITQSELKPSYKEDVFRDLSTKSITFSYSTRNKDLNVQNIDVLLDEESNKVKFIFIRSQKITKDSTVITQFNWKRAKNFLINRSLLRSNGSKYSTQQFVSWNSE
jgi:hypothetical protein